MQKKIKNHKINWQVKFIVKANVYTYVKKKNITNVSTFSMSHKWYSQKENVHMYIRLYTYSINLNYTL